MAVGAGAAAGRRRRRRRGRWCDRLCHIDPVRYDMSRRIKSGARGLKRVSRSGDVDRQSRKSGHTIDRGHRETTPPENARGASWVIDQRDRHGAIESRVNIAQLSSALTVKPNPPPAETGDLGSVVTTKCVGVKTPIAPDLSANHNRPSVPAVIPTGAGLLSTPPAWPAVGIAIVPPNVYSLGLDKPTTSTKPTAPAPVSVNQTLPSGPAVIPDGWEPAG